MAGQTRCPSRAPGRWLGTLHPLHAALALWLSGLLAGTLAAPAPSCPDLAAPVCGWDGISYYSECVAAAQGVAVASQGYCAESFVSFTGGQPAGLTASSTAAGLAAQSAAAVSPRQHRLIPRERAVAQLSAAVMNAHAAEGFVYAGHAQLSRRPHASSRSSTQAGLQQRPGRHASRLPDAVAAVRFTPDGHIYVLRQQQPEQQQQQQAAAPSAQGSQRSNGRTQTERAAASGTSSRSSSGGGGSSTSALVLPPLVPTSQWLTANGSSSSSSSTARTLISSPATQQQHGRRLSIIVGADDRVLCPAGPPAYPYSAIGQIDFEELGTPYICTGSLISSSRVLTAAHCVWDIDAGAFVDFVDFSPARYKAADGKVVNPYGVFKWSHATLLKNYLASNEAEGDVAVIKLDREVPKDAGTLGLKAVCANGEGVGVTTAGYPSDKPEGECYMHTCTVNFDCARESTRHTCDTFMGQSGSSFWDSDFYVRGVHVRGLIDENVNEFTTIGGRVLGKIREWEGQERGGVS